jgi:hypothetical protein
MWLSIPSAERNKVQEGDFLILKKQHSTRIFLLTSEVTKFKVLDISNEAPDAVAVKRQFKALAKITRDSALTKIATGKKEFTFSGPIPNAGNDGFVDALQENVYARFARGSNRSAFYKVVTAGYTGATNAGYSMELSTKLLAVDADWIDGLTVAEEFRIELHEEKRLRKPEYQGRFFVKINRDVAFDENIIYNYTNDPSDYAEKGDSEVEPEDVCGSDPTDSDSGNNNSELAWAEHANADTPLPSGGITGKPSLNSKNFGLIHAAKGEAAGNLDDFSEFITGADNGDFIFEVEPKEAIDLELYYEASEAYPISAIDTEHTLDYFNCYSFGNGVESDRIRDDFNAKRIGKGVKVSSILETEYKQERRKAGLIYSGLFNNTSGVNELNQFIQGLKITKDLNPVYGGIQILKARDTDLVTLCEDKCFRVQANKDALFTADGNPNVTSTNNVLGQTMAYAGEFGISNNPESFTTYGFRSYFTDKARGTVIRLSMDGITEIADKGMSDYFEDKFKAHTGAILGSYDEASSSYNVSLSGDESVAFKEGVNGWTSRLSFVPEAAISLNNDYYTIKDGELWIHSNTTRSNFYGTQNNSTITPIINDVPSSIKNFKTLSYEGDAGWVADVLTDQQDGEVEAWKTKENLHYNYIKGKATTLSNIDTGEFSVQGLGNLNDDAAFSGSGYSLVFTHDINVSLAVGDVIYDATTSSLRTIGTVTNINRTTKTVDVSTSGPLTPHPSQYDFMIFAKDSEKNTSGIIGYHASVEMKTTSSDKKELFAVNSEVFISS